MTGSRNLANPALPRPAAAPTGWRTETWARKVWTALQGYGQLRAAHELERLADHRAPGDPVLARQLRAAAGECRRCAGTIEGEES